ncbi:MAG: hypothetical protein HQK55_17465, partial [Deltaproteobacteria bacterium]|nr:hypothetical protein [Deltaproteobacteria bacterium]
SRLKRADKAKADRVLIIGPEELTCGEAILRDMNTKTQTNVSLADGAEGLSAILGPKTAAVD